MQAIKKDNRQGLRPLFCVVFFNKRLDPFVDPAGNAEAHQPSDGMTYSPYFFCYGAIPTMTSGTAGTPRPCLTTL